MLSRVRGVEIAPGNIIYILCVEFAIAIAELLALRSIRNLAEISEIGFSELRELQYIHWRYGLG